MFRGDVTLQESGRQSDQAERKDQDGAAESCEARDREKRQKRGGGRLAKRAWLLRTRLISPVNFCDGQQ